MNQSVGQKGNPLKKEIKNSLNMLCSKTHPSCRKLFESSERSVEMALPGSPLSLVLG